VDEQVKLRGYRVEPGEIQAVIMSEAEVHDAAVVLHAGEAAGPILVAYVVARDRSLSVAQVKDALATKLPQYMVPATIVLLDELPRTPNGKLDRKRLPAPESIPMEHEYHAPQNEMEKRLAQIWADVLRLDRISVRDNFFDLGGHSLLATTLISRVRDVLEIEVPLAVLFERPSVAAFAETITPMMKEKGKHPSIGIVRLNRDAYRSKIPLT